MSQAPLLPGSITASIGSGFDENFDGGELGSPSAVALDDNSFFVSWVSIFNHNYGSVLGQKIDKSGNAIGEIIVITDRGPGHTSQAAVYKQSDLTKLDNGNIAVVYREDGIDAQIIEPDGTLVGGAIRLSGGNGGPSYGGTRPTITATDDGGFFAFWMSSHTGDWHIYGQKVDNTGSLDGGVFELPKGDFPGGHEPHSATTTDGKVVVAWTAAGPALEVWDVGVVTLDGANGSVLTGPNLVNTYSPSLQKSWMWHPSQMAASLLFMTLIY